MNLAKVQAIATVEHVGVVTDTWLQLFLNDLEKLLGLVEYIPSTSFPFPYSRLGILALSKCQQYVPVYILL